MNTNELKLLYAALMIIEFAYEPNENNQFDMKKALFEFFDHKDEQAGADFLEKLPFPNVTGLDDKGMAERVVHVIQMLGTYSINPNEFLKKKIYAGVDSIICMGLSHRINLGDYLTLQTKIVAQVNKYFEEVCYESN